MGFDDFVNIGQVQVGIPNRLWIHHQHRAGSTTVQTAGLVDADFARASQAGLTDLQLAMIKCRLRIELCTAGFATLAFIGAKENMARVIGRRSRSDFGCIGRSPILVFRTAGRRPVSQWRSEAAPEFH